MVAEEKPQSILAAVWITGPDSEWYFGCRCCHCSVTELCLTLCNLTDLSTPGSSALYWLYLAGQASPPLSPRVCSDSCPLSKWGYLTISSSATHFSFCLRSLPASGSFPASQLFASGGQSIGASSSASVLPMNVQGWFPLGLTSLQSKGLSRVFSSTTIWKHQFFSAQPSLWSNSHICIWLLKEI